ncbi:hypothetical protein CASFOL_006101 [Castilleja foliolosa]|uniref:lipid-A-disaccharide synthase n=1 Tax=Castilleja foliolosa TaxID=1961234 RepID=A0ABD3E5R8_9LAMI
MFLRSVWNVRIGMDMSFLRVVKRSLSVSGRETVRDLASKDGELRVFIVAGEVSGDIIGSRFMNSLTKLSPFPVRFAGVGGVKLRETIESALTFRPHVVLTVDSKGFCFRFLKQLRARYGHNRVACPPHFHYVAPSFWAWRGGESRLKGLSEFVDHVFCILPFEADVLRSNGLAATFVGHPTLEDALELKRGFLERFVLQINKCVDDEWKVEGDGEKFRRDCGISSESTIISVFPGSRLQEVTRMISIFSHTMELLKNVFTELTAVIHVAPNKHVEEYISNAICQWPVSTILVPGGSPCMKYNSFSASRVALCTSGTVAVELQLARLPCVVAYRAHILTEWFIRYKAKIPYISLPNIVLDSDIIPEALFESCTPSRLALLLTDLIHDESLRQKQVSAAGKFLNLLDPLKRDSGNSNQREPTTPSMIAALAVLNSERI